MRQHSSHLGHSDSFLKQFIVSWTWLRSPQTNFFRIKFGPEILSWISGTVENVNRLMNGLHKISAKFTLAFILFAVVLASNGKAEEPSDIEGVFSAEPELGVEFRYDDNIFQSATGVTSSLISIVSPGLFVSAQPSKHRFEFQYEGDFAWYSDSSPDNYEDHYLEAGAYLALGQRSRFDIVGSYDDAHEDRGTGLTEGFVPAINIPPDPDEYQLANILGRFSFGSGASKGQLVLETGYRDLEYTNHLDRTRFFDRSENHADATFYYRVRPKTSLLLDARLTEFDYQNDRTLQPSLNSKEYLYLFGITWDTTAKTTGTVKVGYVEKSYADRTRADFSAPSWELDIRWSPRSYSHLDFSTRRYPSEITSVTGDVIDNTSYSIAWSHEWSNRIKSRIEARDLDQDYRGSAVARTQDLTQYSFSLSYQMRRWLELKAGVGISSRKSNIDRFEFDGNKYSVSALMTL